MYLINSAAGPQISLWSTLAILSWILDVDPSSHRNIHVWRLTIHQLQTIRPVETNAGPSVTLSPLRLLKKSPKSPTGDQKRSGFTSIPKYCIPRVKGDKRILGNSTPKIFAETREIPKSRCGVNVRQFDRCNDGPRQTAKWDAEKGISHLATLKYPATSKTFLFLYSDKNSRFTDSDV